MPNITGATKFFTKAAENTATMTLASSIAAGATTVPISGSSTNYADGDVVAFVIEPSSATNKQVFTGTMLGGSVTNVVWTYGTNVPHTTGVAIVDYVTATDWDLLQKGILAQHNQDGTHGTVTATGTINAVGGLLDNGTSLQTVRSEGLGDYLVAGAWSISAGLNGSMSSLVAYIGGTRVTAAAISSHPFTASKDTYVSVNNSGVLTYTEVANGAASPALPASSLWVAKVITGASAISGIVTGILDSNGRLIATRSSFQTGDTGTSTRQTLPANATTVVTGTAYSYTTGPSTREVNIDASIMFQPGSSGTVAAIFVNGVQASRVFYCDNAIVNNFVTASLFCGYPTTPNTTITIDVRVKTTGTAANVANSTSDTTLGYSPSVRVTPV